MVQHDQLSGRIALVTGGNSGIGRATVLALAAAGAAVAIVARRQEEGEAVAQAVRSRGGEALFIPADISVGEDCRRMVDATLQRFGRLDIAFNNAGITRVGVNIVDDDAAAWDAIYAVNVRGVFLSMKYEMAAMRESGGSIINTSSIGGLVGERGQGAYRASKHAVIGMTKVAALEGAEQGVRVNAICPGVTRTEMLTGTKPSEEHMRRLSAMHPMGRIAESEEVASAVLFLASDAASFVTGQAIAIDGGLTAR